MSLPPLWQQIDDLARDYPITSANLLAEAHVDPRPGRADPVGWWRALVAAHGPERASRYLRQACASSRFPAAPVLAERLDLEGYSEG